MRSSAVCAILATLPGIVSSVDRRDGITLRSASHAASTLIIRGRDAIPTAAVTGSPRSTTVALHLWQLSLDDSRDVAVYAARPVPARIALPRPVSDHSMSSVVTHLACTSSRTIVCSSSLSASRSFPSRGTMRLSNAPSRARRSCLRSLMTEMTRQRARLIHGDGRWVIRPKRRQSCLRCSMRSRDAHLSAAK